MGYVAGFTGLRDLPQAAVFDERPTARARQQRRATAQRPLPDAHARSIPAQQVARKGRNQEPTRHHRSV
ncbi:MAG: hypothetical protein ACYC6Y_17765, partial [Thermoguttaceae bacterium]